LEDYQTPRRSVKRHHNDDRDRRLRAGRERHAETRKLRTTTPDLTLSIATLSFAVTG
jgi:hypothetical protein